MICHGAQGLHLALIYRRSSKPAEDRRACLTLKLERSLSIAADCSWLCSRPCGDGAFSVPCGPTGFCCGCRRSCPVITRFSSKDRLLSKRGRCSLAVDRIGRWCGKAALGWKSCHCPQCHYLTAGWLQTVEAGWKKHCSLLKIYYYFLPVWKSHLLNEERDFLKHN